MILAIRTDQPRAELYLMGTDGRETDREVWDAGRQLSRQLLTNIDALLRRNNLSHQDLTGLVVFKGPGSFTGLRIGIAAGNTMAYGLGIPIAGAKGDNWLNRGINKLARDGQPGQVVLPEYGSEPNITKPR